MIRVDLGASMARRNKDSAGRVTTMIRVDIYFTILPSIRFLGWATTMIRVDKVCRAITREIWMVLGNNYDKSWPKELAGDQNWRDVLLSNNYDRSWLSATARQSLNALYVEVTTMIRVDQIWACLIWTNELVLSNNYDIGVDSPSFPLKGAHDTQLSNSYDKSWPITNKVGKIASILIVE